MLDLIIRLRCPSIVTMEVICRKSKRFSRNGFWLKSSHSMVNAGYGHYHRGATPLNAWEWLHHYSMKIKTPHIFSWSFNFPLSVKFCVNNTNMSILTKLTITQKTRVKYLPLKYSNYLVCYRYYVLRNSGYLPTNVHYPDKGMVPPDNKLRWTQWRDLHLPWKREQRMRNQWVRDGWVLKRRWSGGLGEVLHRQRWEGILREWICGWADVLQHKVVWFRHWGSSQSV